MLQKHEYQKMLELIPGPAFTVSDHTIRLCNSLALSMGFTPGSSILERFSTGREEYMHLSHGCLLATMQMHDTLWNATIVCLEDQYLFRMEQGGINPQLKSLLLMSTELRLSVANLTLITNQLFDQGDKVLSAAANRELHKILRVLNNVSNAARYTEDRSAFMEELNICSVLEEFMEECAALLEKAGITLHYTLPDGPIYTLADWQMLRQAVYALLDNAAKHTKHGGFIDVTLTQQDSLLRLTVSDNGPGIPEETMSSLFTRYTRDPRLEDPRTGLGLGFVLVRSAAMTHGGTVLVDTQADNGTRVTLTLAIHQSKQLKLHTNPLWIIPAPDDGRIMLSNVLPQELYTPQSQ